LNFDEGQLKGAAHERKNTRRQKTIREFLQPPMLHEVLPGAKGLATVIKHLIENRIWNEIQEQGKHLPIKKKSKNTFSALFQHVIANYYFKMEQMCELHDLLRILLDRQSDMIGNIFAQQNFKLNIQFEEE